MKGSRGRKGLYGIETHVGGGGPHLFRHCRGAASAFRPDPPPAPRPRRPGPTGGRRLVARRAPPSSNGTFTAPQDARGEWAPGRPTVLSRKGSCQRTFARDSIVGTRVIVARSTRRCSSTQSYKSGGVVGEGWVRGGAPSLTTEPGGTSPPSRD